MKLGDRRVSENGQTFSALILYVVIVSKIIVKCLRSASFLYNIEIQILTETLYQHERQQ